MWSQIAFVLMLLMQAWMTIVLISLYRIVQGSRLLMKSIDALDEAEERLRADDLVGYRSAMDESVDLLNRAEQIETDLIPIMLCKSKVRAS